MIRQIYWLLSTQVGIDPLRLLNSIRGLPRYLYNLRSFRAGYRGILTLKPCLQDRNQPGGEALNEYFWQDLQVARWVYSASPARHLDVGSRVDGFVAHIASFRDLDVLDVRPVPSEMSGINFRQGDLLDSTSIEALVSTQSGQYDSVSCLHVLEHLGLGRYGDQVDPEGYKIGIANLAKLVSTGGQLYLSTPIGRERVEFDANWVFSPSRLLDLTTKAGFELKQLLIFQPGKGAFEVASTDPQPQLVELSSNPYSLALMRLTRAS